MNRTILKQSIRFYLSLLIYWILLFILQKVIFLLFHLKLTLQLPIQEIAGIFYHGFSMDLSAAFYGMLLPTILIIFSWVLPWKILRSAMDAYIMIMLVALSLLFVADLELYHFWNYRIDKTPLKYLDAPGVMFTSVSLWIIIRQLILTGVLIIACWYAYRKFIRSLLIHNKRYSWPVIPVYLFILAFSIVPIRGALVWPR